jgi:hypothetical protein
MKQDSQAIPMFASFDRLPVEAMQQHIRYKVEYPQA